LKLSVIIPVKTFSKAKSRLDLDNDVKEELCKIMFEEVLHTISISNTIDSIVVVTKDPKVVDIAKKFDTVIIDDDDESGVNHAVSLADKYLITKNFDASIVFPQDIPFMKTQDIDFLLQFFCSPKCALIVPSRKFDGTNALLRLPIDLMDTHYDEDSYKIHLQTGKEKTENTSLVFVKRIMMDIDGLDDLNHCLTLNEKPEICKKISDLLQ